MSFFSLNNYFDAVLVINMDKDDNRLQQISKQLNSSNINTTFTRIPGVTPTKDFRDKHTTTAANLFGTNGQIGCAASHKHAWEYIIKHNLKNALILEDDVMICDHISTTLPAALEEIRTITSPPDLLFLGCMSCDEQTLFDKFFGIKTTPETLTKHIKKPKVMVGTEAYSLTNRGAKLLLENTPKIPIYHLDYYFTKHTPYLTKYSIYPSVMFQDHMGFVHSNTTSKAPCYMNHVLSSYRVSPSPTDGRTYAWLFSMPFAQIISKSIQLNTWFFIFFLMNITGIPIAIADCALSPHCPISQYSSLLIASVIGTLTLVTLKQFFTWVNQGYPKTPTF